MAIDKAELLEFVEGFEYGSYRENDLVRILKSLVTDDDKAYMDAEGLDFYDCLNGRYNGLQEVRLEEVYTRINAEYARQLGQNKKIFLVD